MRTLGLLAVSAVAALVVTLPSSGQERRFGGFGQGGGIMLLTQESVQKDLKLSKEQVEKLTEATKKQQEAFKGLSREERREKGAELRKEAQKTVSEILTPEQAKRLKQIGLQQQGGLALLNPEVAKDLNVTDEQAEKIKDIGGELRKEMGELFQGGNREEAMKKMPELTKVASGKVQHLLTKEQKTKWKEMTGEPFKGEIHFQAPGRRSR